MNKIQSPFWVIVRKEVADHVRSWKFIILIAIIALPSFVFFINFLGPLLGIALGFDAINSEQSKGTLSRILSQPIHRDYLINAKFVGALIVIGSMLLALALLVMGFGLIAIGIPPTAEEFLRIIAFVVVSIIYVAFWLNLSIGR